MASPGDKKGQRRGLCGHVMASFDLHDKWARCRDKLIGEDDCVKDKPCKVCDGFLAPATRPTGPVEVPVAVDALAKTKAVDQKEKKKSHKSRKEKHSSQD